MLPQKLFTVKYPTLSTFQIVSVDRWGYHPRLLLLGFQAPVTHPFTPPTYFTS